MEDKEIIRTAIRNALNEAVNNFLKKHKETATKQLSDSSNSKLIGDPISDVKLNQQANELGSDGKNAPTVSVTAGESKGGTDFTTGQKKANFHSKTKQAE